MQLYAFDRLGQLIFSCQAQKKLNYRCLECGAIVRLREGLIRHSHFYHLKKHSPCRQNGKSAIHLQLQLHLKKLLPDVTLEQRFQEISRIADVAWPTKKIIFEIQCSPLSREEMEMRVRDYAALGYQVVWILHDQQYNQWKMSALEYGLKERPHYFTNMDETGEGCFYDQWQYIEKGVRKASLPPIPIDLSQPYIKGKLGFQGDIKSLPIHHPYLLKIKEKEQELAALKHKESFIGFIQKRYDHIMKTLLRQHCE